MSIGKKREHASVWDLLKLPVAMTLTEQLRYRRSWFDGTNGTRLGTVNVFGATNSRPIGDTITGTRSGGNRLTNVPFVSKTKDMQTIQMTRLILLYGKALDTLRLCASSMTDWEFVIEVEQLVKDMENARDDV